MKHAIYKGELHFKATEEQRKAVKRLIVRFFPTRCSRSYNQTAYHLKHLIQMWFNFELTIDDVDTIMIELGYANNVGCRYKLLKTEYNTFVLASEWAGRRRSVLKTNIDYRSYELSNDEREAMSRVIDDILEAGKDENTLPISIKSLARYLEIKTGISNIPIWAVDCATREKKIPRRIGVPELDQSAALRMPKTFVNAVKLDAALRIK